MNFYEGKDARLLGWIKYVFERFLGYSPNLFWIYFYI
jgi:hypothetical protein